MFEIKQIQKILYKTLVIYKKTQQDFSRTEEVKNNSKFAQKDFSKSLAKFITLWKNLKLTKRHLTKPNLTNPVSTLKIGLKVRLS